MGENRFAAKQKEVDKMGKLTPKETFMKKKKKAPKEGSAAEENAESPAFEKAEMASGVDKTKYK